MNDVENRLTAALNALAEEAEIDHDAWQQNEDRLHERPRSNARRYLTMSGIGLAAASVAAVVAVAVWPHGHGPSTPAVTPTSTATPAPSKPSHTTEPSKSPGATTTTPPVSSTGTGAAENLEIPSDVRQQLLTSFLAAKRMAASQVSGTRPGSVYYGYMPATQTYWAVADFNLSPTATEQSQIEFQDGASRGVFHRQAGQPWQVTIGGIPWPCPGDLPAAMMSVWNLSISSACPIVDATAPDRIEPTTSITLSDGTYYGFFEELQFNYDGNGSVLFDPYTWPGGGAAADNQPAALAFLDLNSRTTTKYVNGSQSGVTEGVFDGAFARRVADAMPQFVHHPSYGYVVTVQNQQITSVTEIGPNNPMPASHPSYIEPGN